MEKLDKLNLSNSGFNKSELVRISKFYHKPFREVLDLQAKITNRFCHFNYQKLDAKELNKYDNYATKLCLEHYKRKSIHEHSLKSQPHIQNFPRNEQNFFGHNFKDFFKNYFSNRFS